MSLYFVGGGGSLLHNLRERDPSLQQGRIWLYIMNLHDTCGQGKSFYLMLLGSGDTEIDRVVLNADERRVRFATCKRDAARLAGSSDNLKRAGNVFMATDRYAAWQVEWVGIALTGRAR